MLTHPRICLITNRYPAHPDDVASPFVRDFHLGLKKRGVDISVFTPDYQTERTDWVKDVIRFRWKGGEKVVGSLNLFNPREFSQLLSFLRDGKRQLLEHLKKTRPHSCLALWALPSGWFAYQAKRELSIPYSVWCLGSDIYVWSRKPILRKMIRKVLKEADHLFADGFDLKERVEKLSGKRCLFLPSMRKLHPECDNKAPLDPEKFNFLYVGRWDKKKGLDDLIKAFFLVQRRLSYVYLHLIGWGQFEKKMRKRIKKLKLEGKVKIVGKVSIDLMANYIKQADCLIIPSKSDSIPLVFSEALQMRTPLIVTDVGDMGYLVKRFELGQVVKPADSQKLAQAMIDFVLEKKDYTKNMPEGLKLLSIDQAVSDYLNIIAKDHHPALTTSMVNLTSPATPQVFRKSRI